MSDERKPDTDNDKPITFTEWHRRIITATPPSEQRPRPSLELRMPVVFPEHKFSADQHFIYRAPYFDREAENKRMMLDLIRSIVQALWVKELAKGIAQRNANRESLS